MVTVDDTKVKLQIWDTAGQERFRSVTHAYYRDAHALLLLYDVTSKTSFDNIRAWLGEIREYAQDDVVIMLLGKSLTINLITYWLISPVGSDPSFKLCFTQQICYFQTEFQLLAWGLVFAKFLQTFCTLAVILG